MNPQLFPLSRRQNLVEQELNGEVLIYDLKIHKAYCLNETCAMVWQLCDGTKSVGEISQLIGGKLKASVTEDFVWLALNELRAENLLDQSREIGTGIAGVSRRELISKAGLATMIALPLITSLAAPRAVDAQSGGACAVGSACTCSVANATGSSQPCILLLGGVSTCPAVTGCDCLVNNGGNTGVCIPG